MSLTAGQLIAASLRIIGVLASGEDPGATEQSEALVALNDMIDGWSNENLLIPAKVREVFPLVINQQTYTMGIGGNFNTTRPQKIENCLIQLATNSPVLEIPMMILTKDEFAAIIIKTLTSTFPLYMYPDGNFPLDNLNFWPIPDTSVNSVVLYSWKPLVDLATITTSIILPPGYQRALKYGLAVELADEYGKTLPETVIAKAIESKATIKRMNYVPHFLQVDKEIRAKPAVWNWLTGEPI